MLAALSSERAAGFLGRLLTQPVQLLYRLARSDRKIDLSQSVLELRHESVGLLRGGGWIQLSLGMLAYSALQFLLLWASLHMLGTTLTAPEIFAGYALERVLTLIMITPGRHRLRRGGHDRPADRRLSAATRSPPWPGC